MEKKRNKDEENVGVPGFLGAVLKSLLRGMQSSVMASAAKVLTRKL